MSVETLAKNIQLKEYLKSREFYLLRSLLGYDWAMFYFLIGGREAGKSYAVTEFFVKQWKKYGRPFYWLRLTDKSMRKLLNNNAEKLSAPDIRRRFKLDLTTSGNNVYEVTKRDKKGKIREKKLMAKVLALSTFYDDKGSGLFDKDFLDDPRMYYNICLDEMNREQSEKKTFDIVYAFANQCENIVRSTKKRLRIICIGNYLDEASDILCSFNFMPEEFGRYKLKSKRAVVEYIEPSESYLKRRKGTVADILMGYASTFTNQIDTDNTIVTKQRLIKPTQIIKFGKSEGECFTVWDGHVIAPYKHEKAPTTISMRPYLDTVYVPEQRAAVFELFDTRCYLFKSLIAFKRFQQNLAALRAK